MVRTLHMSQNPVDCLLLHKDLRRFHISEKAYCLHLLDTGVTADGFKNFDYASD